MRALCGSDTACRSDARRIDTLLLSVGVNDTGFSTIVIGCAVGSLADATVEDLIIPGVLDLLGNLSWDEIKNRGVDLLLGLYDEYLGSWLRFVGGIFDPNKFECGETIEPIVQANLAALWAHNDLLARFIKGDGAAVIQEIQASRYNYYWLPDGMRGNMVDIYSPLPPNVLRSIAPREVYVTTYPSPLFFDERFNPGGCGAFSGISADEARWLYKVGERLNRQIALMAHQHRWYVVEGISSDFNRHGYCAPAGGEAGTWFVPLTGSVIGQSNIDGTVHPNIYGHRASAARIMETYRGEKPDWAPHYRVKVTFDTVTLTDRRSDPDKLALLTVRVADGWGRNVVGPQQLDAPVGPPYTLPAGFGAYTARLAADEAVVVAAHARFSPTELPSDPKCDPSIGACSESRPGATLGSERTYDLSNRFGADAPWCSSRQVQPYQWEAACTVRSQGGDAGLDVSYRIEALNLRHPALPPVIVDPGEICGPWCADQPQPLYPQLDQYRQVVAEEVSELERRALELIRLGVERTAPTLTSELADYHGGPGAAYAAAHLPDGGLAIAGEGVTADGGRQALVVRYDPSGERSAGFGAEGLLLLGGPNGAAARAVAPYPGGRLLVAGLSDAGGGDMVVWRLLPDGSFDPAFNGGRPQTIDFGAGADSAQAVLPLGDGAAIVAGFAQSADGNDVALARLLPDGSLDPGFGEGGRVRTRLGPGYTRAFDVALQPDGKIVVAGGHLGDAVALRYMPDGSLDPGFGEGGVARVALSGNDVAHAVRVLPGGEIALGGYSDGDLALTIIGPHGEPATWRRGRADFGGDELAYGMGVLSDGRIVLAGGRRGDDPRGGPILVARFTLAESGPALDATFGEGGLERIALGDGAVARAVAVDGADRVVIAGLGSRAGAEQVALVRDQRAIRRASAPPVLTRLPLVWAGGPNP